MNKEVNERAFNIAIFDKNSKLWRKPLDINKLSPRFKKSVTKESLTPDNALMLENIIYISNVKLLHRINKGSYVPLYEILDLLGIPVKDNQVLAGWDADNYDPSVPIFEYEYDEANDRYILNFVTCDETMLLKHYEKDRMTNIKKCCDHDTSVLQDVHYVKVPVNHIVIDFDIPDENGEKSFEKNLEAGIHLHYIYDGDVTELPRIIFEIVAISSDHGNALMDIIGPDKYAEVMGKQGK